MKGETGSSVKLYLQSARENVARAALAYFFRCKRVDDPGAVAHGHRGADERAVQGYAGVQQRAQNRVEYRAVDAAISA